MQPPAQQAPHMGFSMGGGGVRIKWEGGDFSVEALQRAVVEGQGFQKPRFMGAVLLGLSVLFIVGNMALIFVLNRYYPYLYGLAAIFLFGGTWLLITGQPGANEDGSPAPMWGRIGLGVAMALGVVLGALMVVLNWEFLVF
jgi:hypothetical protein